ncbi:MASE1 domain-containing protein [Streptomyces sp. NPDC001820]|uniref:MASE1 domain-containing protein n=1 Tax=Streptomyces sp. NPDC001820 TaxID=3364613 RepID=UPI0036A95442
MVRNEDMRRYGSAALQILAVAAVYYGAAKLGLLQQVVRGQVTPLWPPTGVAVAGLLLLGLRIWPGIALGAFLVNVSLGPSLPAVLIITAGNTLAPVCAYLLLRRVGFHNELDRLRDALALIFLGALGAMLISSTVGSGVLVLAGALQPSDFWPTWSVWWTGDAMGVLVVAPFLLVVRTARWPRAPLTRWAEATALLTGTLAVMYLATDTGIPSLLFLAFPFLIWAAFRFQLAGAAPCALGVSTLAILAAARQIGPFAHQDLFANMVTLQAFNGAAALTALLVSAVIIERNRTQEEIRRVVVQLSEMVAQMEPRPATYRWPPPEDDEGRGASPG